MNAVEYSESARELTVSGEITFKTVSKMRQQGDRFIQQCQSESIAINLQQVTHNDITGLALLIAWLRFGKERGIKVSFSNLPSSILRIAEVCDVKDLLKFSTDTD